MRYNYKKTTIACFVGIFVQAIITNLTAILFIPLMNLYGLNFVHLGILISVNFTSQVSADIIFSNIIDKIGYKRLALPSNIMAFFGLLLFALSPNIFKNNIFTGLVISTIIFSFSSGILEVILSPIIAAIPGNDKGPAMSMLHSFYAWGQVVTIILTTLFIFIFGNRNWQVIVLVWALIPIINFFMFLTSPFPNAISEEHRQNLKDIIFRPFYILTLLAIFFGAGAEVVMNQWTSSFMEKGLELPKLTGDLLGMCGFAVMLGMGRVIYGIFGSKINIHKVLISGSLLATLCYVIVAISPFSVISIFACVICGFAVSLLWPGTIVVSSDRYPLAGAWLFAILAVAGDFGAAFAPWLTGVIIDSSKSLNIVLYISKIFKINIGQSSMRFGILISLIFPLMAAIVHFALYKLKKKV